MDTRAYTVYYTVYIKQWASSFHNLLILEISIVFRTACTQYVSQLYKYMLVLFCVNSMKTNYKKEKKKQNKTDYQ